MEISPHRGIDDILLGASRADIKTQLGAPEKVMRGEYEDEVESEIWTYRLLRLELAFDSDVDFRLARITTTYPDVHIGGFNPIGLTEKFLLMKYPHLEVQIDYGDDGKDFIDRTTDISFWVEKGKVENITIYPQYDDIEQVPRWPRN
ncbi:MAG: hypothetical protein ACU84Q_16760 [Gammaproteobacteria bacterium]